MRACGRAIFWNALKTALIAAICLGPTVAARAATLNTSAEAVVVTPLSIVKTDDLRFGAIIPGAAPGTVTINESTGARTSTGPLTLVSSDYGPAEFLGLGQGTLLVRFRRIGTGAVTLTRVGGGATMTLTNLTGVPRFVLFPGSGILRFPLGGRLNVGANQAPGTYVGSLVLELTYF
jgi:hypothetical protein